MIFNQFDPNQDVVAGRTTRVASGFWPSGLTNWSQSNGFLVDDFWSLTGSVGTPSYGTSLYDIRRTMYYLNVFPGSSFFPNDPFFSLTYGNIAGDLGSGSFSLESASIQASPTKAVYTEFKNMLLGSADLDGLFTMQSGSTTVGANDIWVIDFSAFKMKDRIDEGLLEFSLSGSLGQFTFIDNSPFTSQAQAVYQIIAGTLASPPSTPTYEGLGLFYPSNGIIVLNAALMAAKLGITSTVGVGLNGPSGTPGQSWVYNSGLETNPLILYTYNHKTLFESMALCQTTIKVRKSEFVPARHYFIRVKNRDFNYSNNPTFVFDGTDGVHAKGTIRFADFISDPRSYITTVGLYNDSNELVAVAKLSRPAVKSFDQELLIKVRLDF
jgi:hypothetical protein